MQIFLLMSPVVTEGNNLYNLCMAPAPAPAPCITVSLYRCIVFSSGPIINVIGKCVCKGCPYRCYVLKFNTLANLYE